MKVLAKLFFQRLWMQDILSSLAKTCHFAMFFKYYLLVRLSLDAKLCVASLIKNVNSSTGIKLSYPGSKAQ